MNDNTGSVSGRDALHSKLLKKLVGSSSAPLNDSSGIFSSNYSNTGGGLCAEVSTLPNNCISESASSHLNIAPSFLPPPFRNNGVGHLASVDTHRESEVLSSAGLLSKSDGRDGEGGLGGGFNPALYGSQTSSEYGYGENGIADGTPEFVSSFSSFLSTDASEVRESAALAASSVTELNGSFPLGSTFAVLGAKAVDHLSKFGPTRSLVSNAADSPSRFVSPGNSVPLKVLVGSDSADLNETSGIFSSNYTNTGGGACALVSERVKGNLRETRKRTIKQISVSSHRSFEDDDPDYEPPRLRPRNGRLSNCNVDRLQSTSSRSKNARRKVSRGGGDSGIGISYTSSSSSVLGTSVGSSTCNEAPRDFTGFYVHENPVRFNRIKENYLGPMDQICSKCGAKFFRGEQRKKTDGSFSHCCRNGKIQVIPRNDFPEELRELFMSHDDTPNFREHIRRYNSAFAFASFRHQSRNMPPGQGAPCYNINGMVYHCMGHVHPEDGDDNKRLYLQLYWLDPSMSLPLRFNNEINRGVFWHTMEILENLIRRVSPFVSAINMLKEVAQEHIDSIPNLTLCIVNDQEKHRAFSGSHNPITANEVAVVYEDYGGEEPLCAAHRAIHLKGRGLQVLSTTDPYIDAYTYPLFFPRGDRGWFPNGMKLIGVEAEVQGDVNQNAEENEEEDLDIGDGFDLGGDTEERRRSKKKRKPRQYVTSQEYYRYLLQDRGSNGVFRPFLLGGKLTEQFCCDSFLKIEHQRLGWVSRNQTKLRVQSYLGLHDFLSREAARRGLTTGKVKILPSSFTEGPRYMYQLYADAMTMVRELGMPDYFITVTCNPKWVEILENRGGVPGQERKDLQVRVFRQKLAEVMKEILKRRLFGKVKGWCYTIEFQKRGLPHAHILLIMEDADKPRTAAQVNRKISAEIPNPIEHPELYAKVRKWMIHKPCDGEDGGVCCVPDEVTGLPKCTKRFPKPFRQETNVDVDSFAEVRRRDNSKSGEVWDGQPMDNSWVVHYNPELLMKFNCHINVEVVSSVSAVKYIYKYIYKGSDRTSLNVVDTSLEHDEVSNYKNSRYVCSSQSLWRVYEFKTHGRSHAVVRLPVHEEYGQQVEFVEGEEAAALEKAQKKGTMLTAYFLLNEHDTEAREHYYIDIPKYYHWEDDKWKKRTSPREHRTIGRIASTRPNDVERDSIRRLLLVRKGCKSFKELLTVDGVPQASAKEALIKLGYAEGYDYCRVVMNDAVFVASPKTIRELFVTLCAMYGPASAPELSGEFQTHLIADFQRGGDSEETAVKRALDHIREELEELGLNFTDFQLPDVGPPMESVQTEEYRHYGILENVNKLNADQRRALLAFLNAVTKMTGIKFSEFFSDFDFRFGVPQNVVSSRLFFLDGPGGTGKTFVYNLLCDICRVKGVNVSCVAPTGIAASLLKGGRTVHSKFKLPLNLYAHSSSGLDFEDSVAEEIRSMHILIWDEIGMTRRNMFDVVSRTFTDFRVRVGERRSTEPFGGCIVIAGGDFRQQLPVVIRGNRADYGNVCVKSSVLWRQFKRLALRKNMRTRADQVEHASFLLQVGSHALPKPPPSLPPEYMALPPELVIDSSTNPHALIDFIFGTEEEIIMCGDLKSMASKVILCPTNQETFEVNEEILRRLPGELMTMKSLDKLSVKPGVAFSCDPEYLHSLTPSGMPPHDLKLKPGCLIMLLRNIKPAKGLCNGARMIVNAVTSHNLLDCELISGLHKGKRVLVPKMPLETSESEQCVPFSRVQFPVRVCYGMTIAKSQGQSLEAVGLSLSRPSFTHGQIYTALSRCTSRDKLRVDARGSSIVKDGITYIKNMVFKEVL